MNYFVEKQYYLQLLYLFKDTIEQAIDQHIPLYHQIKGRYLFTDTHIQIVYAHTRYYISYVYLDKLLLKYKENQRKSKSSKK